MKKILLLISFLFGLQFSFGQFFKENGYYEAEIGTISSFLVKNDEGETKLFTVGGVNLRGGIGIHNDEEALFIGINSGMDANFRWRIGILPVYLNSNVALDIAD